MGPIPFSDAASARRSGYAGIGDFSASLGLAWRATSTVSFEAGYRVRYLWNARESFNFANASAFSSTFGHFDEKKDALIQNPYIKGVIRF